MKRTFLLVVSSLILMGLVIMLTLIQGQPVRTVPGPGTPTPHLDGYETTLFNQSRGTFLPTAPTTAPQKYTDLSPELSFDKKVAVHILHADGTRERYDMARSMFYSFIKKLPREDTLLSVSAIVMGSGGYAMPTSVEISPTPKITDLLPSLNSNEKATLIVRHMDGSEEIFLIAPDRVDLFIHILPTEDTVIQVISPRGAESKPEVIPLTPDQ
jgi:hypothetical protein